MNIDQFVAIWTNQINESVSINEAANALDSRLNDYAFAVNWIANETETIIPAHWVTSDISPNRFMQRAFYTLSSFSKWRALDSATKQLALTTLYSICRKRKDIDFLYKVYNVLFNLSASCDREHTITNPTAKEFRHCIARARGLPAALVRLEIQGRRCCLAVSLYNPTALCGYIEISDNIAQRIEEDPTWVYDLPVEVQGHGRDYIYEGQQYAYLDKPMMLATGFLVVNDTDKTAQDMIEYLTEAVEYLNDYDDIRSKMSRGQFKNSFKTPTFTKPLLLTWVP